MYRVYLIKCCKLIIMVNAEQLNFNCTGRIRAMRSDKTFRFAVSYKQKASYEEAFVSAVVVVFPFLGRF